MEKQTDGFRGMGENRSVYSDGPGLKLHPLYTAVAELDRDPAGVLYSAKYEAEAQKVLVKSVGSGIAVDDAAQADPPPESLRLLDRITGSDGRQLIVLEFPKASSLKRVLDRQGNMTVRPAVSVISKVLTALSYLHERQRVFGTLSSGAVFLSRVSGGKLKLQLAYLGLKSDGRSLNHIEYRPPEWTQPGRTPNSADDLFAAGVLLYEMLFGLMPFQSADQHSAAGDAAGRDVYLPAAFESRHPTEAAVLRRMLHSHPDQRFGSAEAITDALQGRVASAVTEVEAPIHGGLPSAPRSSIPTVPSPPRDSLIIETTASDEDITRPYSIPAIAAYRSRRSDAGAPPPTRVVKLIAVAAVIMLLPIALWLFFGGRVLNGGADEEKKPPSTPSPASLTPARLANPSAEDGISEALSNRDAVDAKSVTGEQKPPLKEADTDPDLRRMSGSTSGSEGVGAHRNGKRKKKNVPAEKSGPTDNLSSNPFPLRNNPFPTGD